MFVYFHCSNEWGVCLSQHPLSHLGSRGRESHAPNWPHQLETLLGTYTTNPHQPMNIWILLQWDSKILVYGLCKPMIRAHSPIFTLTNPNGCIRCHSFCNWCHCQPPSFLPRASESPTFLLPSTLAHSPSALHCNQFSLVVRYEGVRGCEVWGFSSSMLCTSSLIHTTWGPTKSSPIGHFYLRNDAAGEKCFPRT